MFFPTVKLAVGGPRLGRMTQSPHAVTTITGEPVPGSLVWRDSWGRFDPNRAEGFAQAIARMEQHRKVGDLGSAKVAAQSGNGVLEQSPRIQLEKVREAALEMQRLLIGANLPDRSGVVHVISALQIPTDRPVIYRLLTNGRGNIDLRIHAESGLAIEPQPYETILAQGRILREEGRVHWEGRLSASRIRREGPAADPRTGWIHYTLEGDIFGTESVFYRAQQTMEIFFGTGDGSFSRYLPLPQAEINLENRTSPSANAEAAVTSMERFRPFRVVHPTQLAYPTLPPFRRRVALTRLERTEPTRLPGYRVHRRQVEVPPPWFIQLVTLADGSPEVRAESRLTNRQKGPWSGEAALSGREDRLLASGMLIVGEDPERHQIDIHGSPDLGTVGTVIRTLALLGIEAVLTPGESISIVE